MPDLSPQSVAFLVFPNVTQLDLTGPAAAGEHVAETMTWALDSIYLPPSRIPSNSAAELAAGYELLTGTPAPVLEIAPALTAEKAPVGEREILDAGSIADGADLG